jgi:imidazolonepropionase-like amidohydrolase
MTLARTNFVNARIFDGIRSEYLEESVVIVENDWIAAVERKSGSSMTGDVIDVAGKTLMPGLIDAHCHVLGSSLRVTDTETQPVTYVASYASKMLGHALDCGFTTLRDVGGGDMGIARAVEDRLIKGPRVFFAGRVLSMTGGHGDFRDPFSTIGACGCGAEGRVAVLVDGADAVRAAAREELRRGAHCVKIMLSGGVLSPTDPIWMDQFSDAEVLAAVEEAARRRKYVAAHCHPPSSIERAARLGVRTIEHATLIDEASAAAVKAAGAYVVPTTVIVRALIDDVKSGLLPAWAGAKLAEVSDSSLRGLEIMDRQDLKIGFGHGSPGTSPPAANPGVCDSARGAIRAKNPAVRDVRQRRDLDGAQIGQDSTWVPCRYSHRRRRPADGHQRAGSRRARAVCHHEGRPNSQALSLRRRHE